MNLLRKQKQNAKGKNKLKFQRIIALIISIAAPIAAYCISPTKIADEDFMNFLAWILTLIAATAFAVESGPTWWLIVCFYTAFWHVMLIGVPFYGLENLQTAEYGEGLIWYFFVIFCLTMVLSGVIGIVMKIFMRINKQ